MQGCTAKCTDYNVHCYETNWSLNVGYQFFCQSFVVSSACGSIGVGAHPAPQRVADISYLR